MKNHPFIFSPGVWEGEGIITFSMADDVLPFTVHWNIEPQEEGNISLSQTVFVTGVSEPSKNFFTVSNVTEEQFKIALENESVGKAIGVGLINPKVIAWEFNVEGFQGFEIYELLSNTSYRLRAEFDSGEGYSTKISGQIKSMR